MTVPINTTPLAVMLKQSIHPTYFYNLTSFLACPPSSGSLHVSPLKRKIELAFPPFEANVRPVVSSSIALPC